MDQTPDQLIKHLDDLQSYLRREQPILASLVDEYRKLDQVAYSMGLLPRNQTYADQVSWWPLISVLGTFSAGKSTFINDYLEFSLQRTGHHAVDDKFSVICYSSDGESHVLPGTALDADPRFPFYSIGREIESVVSGEGRKLDSYLQLKTCPCDRLKGKILVDSPGFDADDQRTATLQIADRIIERSDLVLVFFDAHRPEPGAIRDTLEHLVEKAVERHDSTKFVYILNQIDVTADENNLEDVVAAWQRALAQKGLTAGRFYRVFSLTACTHIENEEAARRLIEWREQDMADLDMRFDQVETQRVYRVADSLRQLCTDIETAIVPDLRERLADWRKFVLIGDSIVLSFALVAFLFWLLFGGSWEGLSYTPPELVTSMLDSKLLLSLASATGLSSYIILHYLFRGMARKRYRPASDDIPDHLAAHAFLDKAFMKSTGIYRSIFWSFPAGWNFLTRRKLSGIFTRSGEFIKKLNDMHISPDGGVQKEEKESTQQAGQEKQPDQSETVQVNQAKVEN